jgi:hypothetical protein
MTSEVMQLRCATLAVFGGARRSRPALALRPAVAYRDPSVTAKSMVILPGSRLT